MRNLILTLLQGNKKAKNCIPKVVISNVFRQPGEKSLAFGTALSDSSIIQYVLH